MFGNRKEPILLLLGDVLILYVALFITLFLRYQVIPTEEIISIHLLPFSLLFVMWILIFFISGLYEKHTVILKNKLPGVLFNAQIANTLVAVMFFYFFPFFNIAPKTNLFIYLILSFVFILYWRIRAINFEARRKDLAVFVGTGKEAHELVTEINGNPRYRLYITDEIDIATEPPEGIRTKLSLSVHKIGNGAIIADFEDDRMVSVLPMFYQMIFSHVQFLRMDKMYEDIFDRIPLSVVSHSWFLENISAVPKRVYDILKRLMDVIVSGVLLILSLILYPFVWMAIKHDDGGKLFIKQERMGKNGEKIHIIKFRTMSFDDRGEYNNGSAHANKITRVGAFFRKTRIDELPQLWNVLKGDLSLIGPRPELPALAETYEREIPYYNIRHIIKPGLSGWAQIYHDNHPHHAEAIDQTKEKLSYDLYYVKNRSFLLDLKIALRTITTLLSRSGL